MTSAPAAAPGGGAALASSRPPGALRVFLLLFLPLLVGWAVPVKWVVDGWLLPESYYSHGPLLPLVAAVVLWLGRRWWAAAERHADPRGWWLLGPGLGLHLVGASLMVDSVSAASLLLAVPGALWLGLGLERLTRVLPVVGLLLFAIPLPIFVTGRVAFELKEVAIEGAMGLCNSLGLPVQRQGAYLFVPPQPQPLFVADACGGLRSLIGLTTIGYCLAFFLGLQRGARRWVLLAASVPIAVATNVLRIAGICLLARFSSVAFAAGTGHELLGWVEIVLAVGMLLALDLLLLSRSGRKEAGS